MALAVVPRSFMLAPLLALVLCSTALNSLYRRKKLLSRDVEYKFAKGSLEDGKRRVILVTGGMGLVGREIVRLLLEDGGVAVRCFDLAWSERDQDTRVTRIRGSLENMDHLARAFAGVDSVIHCAALLGPLGVVERDLVRVNIHGTQNVLLACFSRQVKRLVATSSAAAVLSRAAGQATQTGDETQVAYPADKRDHIEPYGWWVAGPARAA
jgi:nucleoside-diphosphate-sugar epimerase